MQLMRRLRSGSLQLERASSERGENRVVDRRLDHTIYVAGKGGGIDFGGN